MWRVGQIRLNNAFLEFSFKNSSFGTLAYSETIACSHGETASRASPGSYLGS